MSAWWRRRLPSVAAVVSVSPVGSVVTRDAVTRAVEIAGRPVDPRPDVLLPAAVLDQLRRAELGELVAEHSRRVRDLG